VVVAIAHHPTIGMFATGALEKVSRGTPCSNRSARRASPRPKNCGPVFLEQQVLTLENGIGVDRTRSSRFGSRRTRPRSSTAGWKRARRQIMAAAAEGGRRTEARHQYRPDRIMARPLRWRRSRSASCFRLEDELGAQLILATRRGFSPHFQATLSGFAPSLSDAKTPLECDARSQEAKSEIEKGFGLLSFSIGLPVGICERQERAGRRAKESERIFAISYDIVVGKRRLLVSQGSTFSLRTQPPQSYPPFLCMRAVF
jgi:hypothetical protein